MPLKKRVPSKTTKPMTEQQEVLYEEKVLMPQMLKGISEQLDERIKEVKRLDEKHEKNKILISEKKARLAKEAEENKKKDDSSDDEETKREKRIAKHKKDKEEKEAREKHYDETYDPDFEIPKDTVHIGKVINQKKKKIKKRQEVKSDSESDSDNEVTHEVFETLAPEMRLDMKTINKYYMLKTPEIKVPDKVIDVDNRGHLSLVNTLDSHGDINKVDGHKVLNVISYVPDNNKDSKIKVKQGKHSDLSKEVKKVEGKLKRSKKPATITKLNNELDELLKKLS